MVKKIRVVLICTIALLISYGCSMENLPEGELIKSVYSDNQEYKINIYLCGGNATTDNSIRGEVEKNSSEEKRNLYWEYHCDDADVEWIDEENVKINGKEININTGVYDWRDE